MVGYRAVFIRIITILVIILFAVTCKPSSIRSVELFFGGLTKTSSPKLYRLKSKNRRVWRDSLIADHKVLSISGNPTRRLADFVVFNVHPRSKSIKKRTKRSVRWRDDPVLPSTHYLKRKHWNGINAMEIPHERGHSAAIRYFQAPDDIKRISFISSAYPQRSTLNRGAWLTLENEIYVFASKFRKVYVAAGPYYKPFEDEEVLYFPNAPEYRIPDAYWNLHAIDIGIDLYAWAYLIPQDSEITDDPTQFQIPIQELEHLLGGIEFFPETPYIDSFNFKDIDDY